MGNWQLEVCKMAMYMAFPVTLFHLFNQPGFFEEWVTETKRELYPPDKLGNREKLQQAIHEYRENHDKKMLQQLEEQEKKPQRN